MTVRKEIDMPDGLANLNEPKLVSNTLSSFWRIRVPLFLTPATCYNWLL